MFVGSGSVNENHGTKRPASGYQPMPDKKPDISLLDMVMAASWTTLLLIALYFLHMVLS